MRMIVGLGNPGQKYASTKHNIGFMAVDEIAAHYQVELNHEKFEAEYGTFFLAGEKVFLVKPLTYMNDSGRAVQALMAYFQIQLDEIVIIYDDMDLPVGKIRLRQHGSAGGHNGIKSLISYLRGSDFNRIRVGTGHPQHGSVVDWVLSPFSKDAQPDVLRSLDNACGAVADWLTQDDFMQTMNRFNRKG